MVRSCHQLVHRRFLLLAALAMPWMLGCGGDSAQQRLDQALPDRGEVVPVSGTVMVDQKPVENLLIRLVPAGTNKPEQTNPRAFTKADGTFSFTTFLENDGVPAGEYRVLVEQLQKVSTTGWAGPDELKNRYNHLDEPASTLTVEDGMPLDDVLIDLQLDNQPGKKEPTYGATHIGKPASKKGRRH